MSIMRFLIPFLFSLLFLSADLSATSIMGGDLTFECTNSGEYLWRLKLYEDCLGAPGINVQPITIAGCGNTYNLALNLVSGPTEVLSSCPFHSTCSGGSLPGVKELIYEGTIVLSVTCLEYTASFRMCCRTHLITTVNVPGIQYVYLEASTNTSVGCNSSPVFNNAPIINTCVGQSLMINPGTFDPDGDSLVYSLVDCLHDQGIPIDYFYPPFNGNNPLSTVSGTVINTQTGTVSFVPNIVQSAPICIRIDEYRSGVKIGEVFRDIQINILPCTNNLPISGPFIENGINTGSYSYDVYPDSSFCLTIEGGDIDVDSITMLWDSSYAFGTFSIAGNYTANPIGTFCWTPTSADIGPNLFTTTLNDNYCPVNGITNTAYIVNVVCDPNATLLVEASVQLEGPYDPSTGLMKDDLRGGGFLPLLEPYTSLGYTHVGGGGEMTNSIVFNQTGSDAIVDWVFVELRESFSSLVPFATRSALLQADGDIVDVDGSSIVKFNNTGLASSQYWIVVRHRNHLDVMSSNAVTINSTTVGSYDFGSSGAFLGGMKTLVNGEQVMYEGDVNQDGSINAADRSALWNTRNQVGYLAEDSSLNSICSAADRSQNWNNRNQLSQVP